MNADVSSEVAAILILTGTIFSFLSAIGIIRLPDVYTRSHAASKSSTLGVLFTLFGAFLFFLFADDFFSIRLLLGIFFVFLTAPISAHVICRAAYRSSVEMSKMSVQDDLKDALRKEQGDS